MLRFMLMAACTTICIVDFTVPTGGLVSIPLPFETLAAAVYAVEHLVLHQMPGVRFLTLGRDRCHIRVRNKSDKYCPISFDDHENVTFGNSRASLPG